MSGHLFVVHGRLEALVHDAAVVPTDDDFAFEDTWSPVLGDADPAALRPEGWPGAGHGRCADGRPLWFVSVGPGLAAEELVARATAIAREVADAGVEPALNRVMPLLAVPVIGIEGGGHSDDRGEVVRLLLQALLDVVADCPLDVALVTPERSVHGAAQHVRGEVRPDRFADEQLDEAARLGTLARKGRLALFFGAGLSVPAGLPGWRAMLDRLAQEAGTDPERLGRLSRLDQAQLLQRRLPQLGEAVVRSLGEHDRPSLGHALLADLGCREAATTNYDQLYERAVEATGRPRPAVLPWEAVGDSWLLKLHGDVSRPESVTLTRRDFVRFDADVRPAGALLQALLLTRHLMLVGASLDDDNVVRLLREVEVFREDCGLSGPIATVLDVDADEARRELWGDQLRWLTLPGEDLPSRARALEILLDAVGWHAVDTGSWLLDPRFAGLLDADGRVAAEEARRLRREVEEQGEEWASVRDALDRAGA
ncbi:SIR2-like domain-containing protein [Nocardioides terrae]|uniref:SIR2-like domain-containing protein n=1 Tax=Nocardioides terrae TaxID=574651 RepID=A0A1I1IC69_9ACTN|nr:SIR2 family protein [Nocardioides terrae]SFC33989.1 SIR2-like domain-containing protein [Nocardioides terrae]